MTVDKNKVGLVGIGDMGSGLAKNLLKAGFDVYGLDLDPVSYTHLTLPTSG